MRAPPAAAGDHRDARDQQHGGPRRHRRSPTACARRPARRRRTSRAPTRRERGVRHALVLGRRRGARPRGRRGHADRDAAGRPPAGRARDALAAAQPAPAARHRRDGRALRRRRAARSPRRCPASSPATTAPAGTPAWRSSARRGVPDAVARRVAGLGALFSALDIVEVSAATERSVEEVAALHFLLGGAAAPALAARPDRGAAARRSLAGDGARRTARRPVQPPRRADGRRPAQRAGGRGRPPRPRSWTRGSPRTRVPRSARSACWTTSGRAGRYDLTTLPVALREVRDLIRAGDAQPSRAPLPAPAGG